MEHVKSVVAGILLLAGAVAVSSAFAYSEIADEVGQQGQGFVGLGVGTVPDYEGSDTNEGTIAPFGRYNWASGDYSVRDFVQDAGIPEDMGADGIHDEYGLTAVMMAAGPENVRYDQRAAADLLTINGVDISDQEAVAEMGRKIIEFRAKVAVDAIHQVLGGGATNSAGDGYDG